MTIITNEVFARILPMIAADLSRLIAEAVLTEIRRADTPRPTRGPHPTIQ